MEINGKSYKVADLMRKPVIINDHVTLKEALAVLIDKQSNIGCVVDDEGKLVGGVSTLDIIRAVLPDYIEFDSVAARFANIDMLKEDVLKAAEKPLSEFVDREEATVTGEASLVEATVISSGDCNGRIIVVDENTKPVGVLSRTEIKQVLAAFLDVRNELDEACANCVDKQCSC